MPHALTIRPSTIPLAGDGVFAEEAIPDHACLGKYEGRRLTQAEFMDLDDTRYVFFVRENMYLDGKEGGNWAAIINGARTREEKDRINVRTQQEGDDIWFYTCRAVAAGEELLLDYGHLYWDETAIH